jgi:O-antigen/teichoic acid export membrane protein
MPENKTPKGGGEGQPEALSQRTKRGFVWSQIGGMLDYGLYLAFSVLIARAIGVQGFGLYGTVVSYASLGLILTILGMERATHVYAAPLAVNEPAKMIYLIRRFLAVRASMGAVVAAVFLVSAGPAMTYLGQPEVGTLLGWMGPYIISMGLTGLFMAYFSAKLELRNSRLLKALMQLLNVGGAFWIYQRGGSVGVVLALLSVTSVLTMLSLGWMTRNVFSGRAEKVDLAPVYSFCRSQTVIENTAFITGKNADILLLNLLLAGTLQVGYYNISAALVLAISTMFVVGTGDVALTATSIMVQMREPAQLMLAWRFRVKCSVLLTVPFMVFAFGIAPIIVATLLDRSFLPAVDVFRVAVAGQILISLIGAAPTPTFSSPRTAMKPSAMSGW